LREGDTDDKSDVYAQIEVAEANILKAQNNIDGLVIDREPLEAKMIKLEAEIGPVKYIAALAIDWGVTNDVDTEEAVRWVILVIICVFDPLAVLLLVAANQSLLRRFPVKPLPPEEVLDLEKPDDEDIALKWNEAMVRKQNDSMQQATDQLKDWKNKLEKFNKKVPKPEEKPVEIVQKKTEQEEIGVHYRDPAEVIKEIEEEKKQEQLEKFKKREQEEQEALEEIARKAKEEELIEQSFADELKDGFDPDEVEGFEEFNRKPEPTISEQIEEVMETERTRPDFTEVLEPEKAVQDMMEDPKKAVEENLRIEKNTAMRGSLGQVIVKSQNKRVVDKIEPKAPKEEYVQNEEQDDKTIWQKSLKRLSTEEEYRAKLDKRIDELMAKLDAGEITLEELTPEDRQTIIDIRMQNESGDNIK
jgi:hypothetical protein